MEGFHGNSFHGGERCKKAYVILIAFFIDGFDYNIMVVVVPFFVGKYVF